jgi:TRAP-type C4-dicarboxylate transport system permease small subunit
MNAFVGAHTVLVKTFAAVAGAIIAGIAVLIPVEVALRALSLPSIYGALDLVQYGMLAATFLAAPWVLMLDAHVSVDLLTMRLAPRWRRRALQFTGAVGAAVSLVLLAVGIDAAVIAYERGSAIRTAFVVPEWIPLSLLPLSALLLAIEFVLKLTGVRPHGEMRVDL